MIMKVDVYVDISWFFFIKEADIDASIEGENDDNEYATTEVTTKERKRKPKREKESSVSFSN